MADAVDHLFNQAAQARRDHRPADARRDLIEAVSTCRKTEERQRLAGALTGLGQIERDLKNPGAALQHYEEAAAIYRSAGKPLKLAHTVRHIGDIHQDEGRLQPAEPYYHEALAIYRAHKETPPLDLANAIRGLALLKSSIGATQEAKALWEEARDLYAAVGVEAGVRESARRIAQIKDILPQMNADERRSE